VNEAFEVDGLAAGVERIAIEVEFQDIRRSHQRRRHAAREQEAVAALVVAHADMPEGVNHVLVIEDVVAVTSSAMRRGSGAGERASASVATADTVAASLSSDGAGMIDPSISLIL